MEHIKDSFHRNIDYIRISVTDRCNFRCSYCMPQGCDRMMNHTDILTYEETTRLCKIFANIGIRKVKLTGGEPLARKNFVSLARKINQIDGIEQVTMTTNGSMLSGHVTELKEAGITGINISLDTLREDRFLQLTGTNQLQNVLSSIQEAWEEGIPSVKINCVPIQGFNDDEICDIAAFAKENKIDVRFIEMMPIGNGKGQAGIGEMDVRQRLEMAYGKLRPVSEVLGNGPASYYQLEGFLGHVGFISAMSHKFCEKCNRIRLTSDGILKTCLQYAGHVSLRDLMREGASDEQIRDAVVQAIREKPECHQFLRQGNTSVCNRNRAEQDAVTSEMSLEERMMSGIGG